MKSKLEEKKLELAEIHAHRPMTDIEKAAVEAEQGSFARVRKLLVICYKEAFDAATDIVIKELASGGEYERRWVQLADENCIESVYPFDPSTVGLPSIYSDDCEEIDDRQAIEFIESTALSAERAKRIEAEERADIAENAMLEIERQNVELHRRIADEQSGIQDRTLEKHLRWELSACESRLKEAEKVISEIEKVDSNDYLKGLDKPTDFAIQQAKGFAIGTIKNLSRQYMEKVK